MPFQQLVPEDFIVFVCGKDSWGFCVFFFISAVIKYRLCSPTGCLFGTDYGHDECFSISHGIFVYSVGEVFRCYENDATYLTEQIMRQDWE